jgi:hypothetical protein
MDIKKIPVKKDENLKLKKLHPLLMKYFTNTLFIAPTGVGKSNLIINLLDRKQFYKGKFDKIILFSNTYYTDRIWKSCKSIEDENVYTDYDDSILQQIIDEQDEAKKNDEPINTLLIFDDIIQQINKQNSLLNSLVMRSRHYHLTIWLTSQKFSRVSTSIRNNISYFVLFGIKNQKEKKFIVDELSDNVGEDKFLKLWNYALDDKNYNFMIISVKDSNKKMFRKQFKSFLNIEEIKKEVKENKEKINSVIFPKDKFNVKDARDWLKKHNYIFDKKVDKVYRPNFLSFRQNSVDVLEKEGYVKYITKKLSNDVELIIAYKV